MTQSVSTLTDICSSPSLSLYESGIDKREVDPMYRQLLNENEQL